MNKKETVWDDKFGMIERTVVIDGVGEDAEIITNANGGKQSKSPMALHLVDPSFLKEFFNNKAQELLYEGKDESLNVDSEDAEMFGCYKAVEAIANYMLIGGNHNLVFAMDYLNGDDSVNQIIKVAKVLQYGADRYEPNNWRLIPEEEHINHALIHIIAHIAGDTQDDHIDHALCRLMMAYATEKSENFNYNTYIPKS